VSTTTDACPSATATHRIGFVGDAGVGKTTVATLVAARLIKRADVTVTGEAAEVVSTADAASTDNGLGISWTIDDCPPGVEAIEARFEGLDTVFVVVTPETLDTAARYADRARYHDVDCLLIVNRFRESAKDSLQAFDGPMIAEYVHEDANVSAAMAGQQVPVLPERTVEAILIEALQPDRQSAKAAVEALTSGTRSTVNVEVADRDDAGSLLDTFEAAGFSAAYFDCNCCCHDGHVLAHRS
jgi:MinD-like ATPase involved in chromosome partitioning or flagellar assembly